MKHALSAVIDGNSTTVLHNFSLWFAQSGLKPQPINSPFPVDVPGHISVWVSSLLSDAAKTEGGEDKKRGSGGQDLNQHGKGETSDKEQRDAQSQRVGEVEGRRQCQGRVLVSMAGGGTCLAGQRGEERAVAVWGSAPAVPRSTLGFMAGFAASVVFFQGRLQKWLGFVSDGLALLWFDFEKVEK